MDKDFSSRKQKIREEEKELRKLQSGSPFEKGDLTALILAALTTVLPFAAGVFLLLFLIPLLLLRLW